MWVARCKNCGFKTEPMESLDELIDDHIVANQKSHWNLNYEHLVIIEQLSQ